MATNGGTGSRLITPSPPRSHAAPHRPKRRQDRCADQKRAGRLPAARQRRPAWKGRLVVPMQHRTKGPGVLGATPEQPIGPFGWWEDDNRGEDALSSGHRRVPRLRRVRTGTTVPGSPTLTPRAGCPGARRRGRCRLSSCWSWAVPPGDRCRRHGWLPGRSNVDLGIGRERGPHKPRAGQRDAPGDLLRMDEDASMATRSPGLPAASAQCGSTHTTVARFFGENRANRWSACAERRRRLLWLAPLLDHGVSLTYGRRWHRAPDLLSLRLGPSPRRRGHKPPTSVSHTVAVGVSAHLIFRGSGTAVDDSAQYPAGVAPTPGITTKGDRAACSVRLPAVRPGTRPGTRRGGERRTAPEQPCWGAVSKAERIAVRDTGDVAPVSCCTPRRAARVTQTGSSSPLPPSTAPVGDG